MHATAAGILLVNDGRLLLLRRRPDADAGGTWAFPGGKIDPGETAEDAARRELTEETGLVLMGGAKLLGVARNGFAAFGARVANAPSPALNDEHTEACWARFDALPSPLHPDMQDWLLQAGNPLAWVRRLAERL